MTYSVAMSPRIETRELTPELWPALETLFGKNGACGGCWCMAWRVKKGEDWQAIQGPTAKRRFKRLVTLGEAHGVLALARSADGDDGPGDGDDDGPGAGPLQPVGWCSYGPRTDFPRLERARTLACDDVERVWSLPCFYIKRGWRGRGVATALLKHALRSLKARGVIVAEGYPAKPSASGAKTPDTFAWTGTRRLFEACGFELAGDPNTSKLRMRRRP
jgi:GNAT superfamily N-acetyltransferase